MKFEEILGYTDLSVQAFEIVERKGRGHPDTLADRLAERLSVAYSRFTKDRAGLILRHQFDKLALMGGRCNVRLGSGEFNSPVRLLLNGRATPRFGSIELNFQEPLFRECKNFLESELANFDFSKDCRVIFETTSNSTRGLVDRFGEPSINYRFAPRSAADIPESSRPLANDTAVGCGYAPRTGVENLVLSIERSLTSNESRSVYPWLGTDVKIMACRINSQVEVTLAVPQICTHVSSYEQYEANFQLIQEKVQDITKGFPEFNVDLHINPSDNIKENSIYLRYTGSCVESGDEGVVGRGNRIGGVIPSRRAFSIEGLNGKNPAYHAGKLYSVAAWVIANAIWRETGTANEVFIISQIDRPLDDPWKVIVHSNSKPRNPLVCNIIERVLSRINKITDELLDGVHELS